MAHFEHNSEKFGYLDLETLDGIQSALDVLGFAPGASDGVDGPRTQDALRRFQTRASIQVDGIVGPETRGALAAALDSDAAIPAPIPVAS